MRVKEYTIVSIFVSYKNRSESFILTEVHKMNRVYNFSAGPSMLPLDVLEKAASELVCYGESGMSVMEMSHRSPDYEAIINDAEAMLRKLMNIPDNYKVLFLQGGASTQFAAVPLNLIGRTGKADYVVSGQFSGKAFKEAQKMGYDVKCIATTKEDNFDHIPTVTKDMIRPDASYVHVCFNNTIYGTKYGYIPETGDIPLVADMSSFARTFLSMLIPKLPQCLSGRSWLKTAQCTILLLATPSIWQSSFMSGYSIWADLT